jgi:hypothetical protein
MADSVSCRRPLLRSLAVHFVIMWYTILCFDWLKSGGVRVELQAEHLGY